MVASWVLPSVKYNCIPICYIFKAAHFWKSSYLWTLGHVNFTGYYITGLSYSISIMKKWNGHIRFKMQFQMAFGPFVYSMEKWRHRIAWSEGDRMTKMVYEVSLLLLAFFFWPLLASTNINIDGKWSPWSNLETGMNIVLKFQQLHTGIVFF